MRVVVIGLGGVGSAAARFLAQDGHEVIALDRFRVDHDQGSSYGGSRIFRLAYQDALYARLMATAFPLWEALERDAGEALLLRCGGLFWGEAEAAGIRETEQSFQAIGAPYEAWAGNASELRRRFPQFAFRPSERVLFQADSGLVRASAVVCANARLAAALGVEIREETWCEQLEIRPDSLELRLSSGETLVTDRVLITAGAWLGRLLPELRLPLQVSRQTYLHLATRPDGPPMSPDACPVWIDMDTQFYGFPEHSDHPGAKVAWHHVDEFVEPDAVAREVTADDERPVLEYAARRLPALTVEVTHRKVCLYTNTPERDFIVDRLPDEPRVTVVGGLSGHGFKFTVILGRLAANLIAGEPPGFDLSRFRLTRFAA